MQPLKEALCDYAQSGIVFIFFIQVFKTFPSHEPIKDQVVIKSTPRLTAPILFRVEFESQFSERKAPNLICVLQVVWCSWVRAHDR